MDKVQSYGEDTQGSGSGSGFSDLSALENETDDFGRRVMQYHRNEKRLDNALRDGRQAFKKPRPKPRVADLLGREERQAALAAVASPEHHERVDIDRRNESRLPVTVPREWGLRTKRQSDWMKHILDPSEPDLQSDDSGSAGQDALYKRRILYTGDRNSFGWTGGADRPLQSIETTPPSMRRHRPVSSPSSMRPMNTTLQMTPGSDDQDFTAASLLASTPAHSNPPRKIDQLTQREVDNIERQALTTRALDQTDERSTNETLRRTSSSNLREQAAADGLLSPPALMRSDIAPGKPSSPSRIPRRRRSPVNSKENVPPNGEQNTVSFKGFEAAGLVNRTSEAVNVMNTERPHRHHRNDSMNLLKKLARVSSMSPSPARDQPPRIEAETAGDRKLNNDAPVDAGPLSAKSVNGDYPIDMKPLKATSDKPDSRNEEQKAEKVETNEQCDPNTKPARERTVQNVDATPIPQKSIQSAKTPEVAGAWVDTTLQSPNESPEREKDEVVIRALSSRRDAATSRSKPSAVSMDEGSKRIKHEPRLPKSALEAIMREAENGETSQQYGESTMQSLEDIVHPTLDPTDPTLTSDLGATVEKPQEQVLDHSHPLTQAEKDRRQESLAMEAMNKHLRAARTSIKDANQGLRRVENRIETAHEHQPSTSRSRQASLSKKPDIAKPTGEREKTPCTCGGTGSVWKALYLEFRSCFYTYEYPHGQENWPRVRFTWLGLSVLLWFSWLLSETTLCTYYCHPQYAYYPGSFTMDPNAPEFPFVIPTLIFRPVRWLWQPVCEALAWSVGAAFHWLFGDASTRINPPQPVVVRPEMMHGFGKRSQFRDSVLKGEWIATAAQASARVTQSIVDAVDEVGSMWDDEFLS